MQVVRITTDYERDRVLDGTYTAFSVSVKCLRMIIVQCNKRLMRRDDMLEGVKRVEKELDRMPEPEPRKRQASSRAVRNRATTKGGRMACCALGVWPDDERWGECVRWVRM